MSAPVPATGYPTTRQKLEAVMHECGATRLTPTIIELAFVRSCEERRQKLNDLAKERAKRSLE